MIGLILNFMGCMGKIYILRQMSCNVCVLLTESFEGQLPWSGLSGPLVLEVFATCRDICVVFNWPV